VHKFRFYALKAYFRVFDAQKYIFSYWYMSHDHTVLVPKFCFGLLRLILAFSPPKKYFFLLLVKFPINGYVTRSYGFCSSNSVFGLWRLIFAFLTLKSILFLTPCKIPDRWICHTIILILEPKFRFWALAAYFRFFNPQKYTFSSSLWNSRSTDRSHDLFHFWAHQCPA
jgi:hypothetical protein